MQISRKVVVGGLPLAAQVLTAHLGLSTVGTATALFGPEALTPGPADPRAVERILGAAKGQLAECFVSVAGQPDYLVAMGPVSGMQRAGNGFQVTVRELCTILEMQTALYLRNCSAREIVATIEKRSKLHFLVPAKSPYLDEIRPVFQFTGTCRAALAKIVQTWELTETVWYQLPNGSVFFGPWRLGPFTNSDLPVDPRLVLEKDMEQHTLRLPLIPALRPGMVVDCGFRFRIDELDFETETVLIKWKRL
jgi:hypothetical protein